MFVENNLFVGQRDILFLMILQCMVTAPFFGAYDYNIIGEDA